jgi:glutaminyl-peptide cyclotransferase
MRLPHLLPIIALAGCAEAAPPPAAVPGEPPVWGYNVVNEYAHDPEAFTQGLFWSEGALFESTGQVGRSTVRKVRLEDGKVLQSVPIPTGLFGEGIVAWGGEIISVTWQTGIGFRWDRATLQRKSSFRYAGEGWGLASDGRSIILSDGTATLRYFDPATMAERSRLTVTAGGRPVQNLNELEWVKGEIFANVWMTSRIARIEPATGEVKGWIELGPMAQQFQSGDPDRVLNGIAYDEAKDRLFVTGKNWPKLFEIKLVAPGPKR